MVAIADRNKCLRCGGCVAVCPKLALDLTEHGIECDAKRCVNCASCVNFCPVEAMSLKK